MLPRSLRNSRPALLIGPRISTVTDMKVYECSSWTYLAIFLSAAASAAAPNDPDVAGREDCVSVSVTVTSQVTHLTFFHGINVSPSGRFPSDLKRPDGSLVAGMFAVDRPRQTRSLRLWCRVDRPLPPLHDSPWTPLASTSAPHGQVGFADIGTKPKSDRGMHCIVIQA